MTLVMIGVMVGVAESGGGMLVVVEALVDVVVEIVVAHYHRHHEKRCQKFHPECYLKTTFQNSSIVTVDGVLSCCGVGKDNDDETEQL